MTCLTGYCAYPEAWNFPSMAEALMRSDKAAVAAFMPTGMTTSGGQHVMDKALFDAIFVQDIRTLGEAVSSAKQVLLANGADYEEVADTFLLFGDPATTLKIPLPEMPAVFAALMQDGLVTLTWEAAADCNGNPVAGYNLYKKTAPDEPYTKVNTARITETAYAALAPEAGETVYYMVKAVDADGDEGVPTTELSVSVASPPLSITTSGGGGGACFVGTVSGFAELY
jgi:hypothetical protein